ncbi:hypothetical protein MKW98_016313 [Papaver atlanticum]|uniref:RecQ-mediated genome instability protein 1 n=1 Tax=Papaver atlanticum TaxID=357466 RepID=A0AAD4SI29_9MAGN|nr:hypothetical protein MKW98_016313 [Papaver atlanticum]
MFHLICPPGPNRTQNQDQCFPDSVAEMMIPLSELSLSSSSSTESSTIDSVLWNRYGLKNLKIEWLNTCFSELSKIIPGFGNLNVADQGDYIYQRFLDSDIRLSSDGVLLLPDNISTVDELVSRHPRPHQRGMLYMTDGVRNVLGWEISPIQALRDLAPGMKVRIGNATVQSGILMLVPGGVEVLGGRVEHLQANCKMPAVVEEEANHGVKISMVGSTVAMSAMDIIEEKFAGCSRIPGIERNPPYNAFPDSADYSHGSIEDKEISLKYLDNFGFKNSTTYGCFVNVADGSRKSMVCIPHKIAKKHYSPKPGCVMSDLKTKLRSFQGTMPVEMTKDSNLPVALEINDEKISFDFRWCLGPQRSKMHPGF